jgi:hypothetical protein
MLSHLGEEPRNPSRHSDKFIVAVVPMAARLRPQQQRQPPGVKPSQCMPTTRPVARPTLFPFHSLSFSRSVPFKFLQRIPLSSRGPLRHSGLRPQVLCCGPPTTRSIPLSAQATPHTPRLPFRDRNSPRCSELVTRWRGASGPTTILIMRGRST